MDRVSAAPAITNGTRGPPRARMRPDSGDDTAIMIGIGSSVRPACSAVYPRTSCRYSVVRNRNPARVAIAQTAVRFAAVNGTLRKNRKSISGSARRGSYFTSVARAVTLTRKKIAIRGESQPSLGPWMIA